MSGTEGDLSSSRQSVRSDKVQPHSLEIAKTPRQFESLNRYKSGYSSGMEDSQNTAGTLLTCDNPECGCELQINTPCPHGTSYSCACGHPLEPKS